MAVLRPTGFSEGQLMQACANTSCFNFITAVIESHRAGFRETASKPHHLSRCHSRTHALLNRE